MSDLIDRQAAIDALHTFFRDGFDEDKWWNSTHVLAAIEGLPSAQPEPNYDEWCTDCKEYDNENSCCPRWTKVIRQTRRELQDEFVMTAVDGTLWVTVDDVQKVDRVIVDEEKSKFCRQFYMDAQPEQRTGKWIPVTERLPEDDTVVLVCGKSGGVYTAIHNNSKTWIRGWWKMNSKNHHCNPTAWMPLPEAYQPKGETE